MTNGKIVLNFDYSEIPADLGNIQKMIDDCSQKVKSAFEQMSEAISSLPTLIESITFTPVLQGANDFLTSIMGLPGQISSSFGEAKTQFDLLKVNIDSCKTKLMGFFSSCQDTGVIDTLGKSIGTFGLQFLAIAAIVLAVSAALVYLYENSETFRALVDESLATLMDLLTKLYETVLVPLFDLLKDIFETVIMPLVTILADVFVTVVSIIFSLLMSLWNSVLAPIADFLVEVFGKAIQAITDIWNEWKPIVEMIIGALSDLWEKCLKPFALWLQDSLGKVFEEFGKLVEGVIDFVLDLFAGIIDFFVGVFTCDMDKAWEGICEIFTAAFAGICSVFAPIIAWFKDLFNDAWEGIKGAFIGVKDFFLGVWNAICSCFTGIANWFGNIFSNAWQAVKDVFSAGGKIFDGIKDGILSTLKSVINALINGINTVIKIPFDGINAALKAIKGVDIFGFKPFSWIGTIDVPQIPKLAKGGIVNRPTLTMIGEAGKEAVLPLQNNTGWMNDLADIMASRNKEHEDKVINLYVDGEKLFTWFKTKQRKERILLNGGIL